MKIALFLDVDMTLTKDYIQHVYAKELGVEDEYRKLEEAFQLGLSADKIKAKDGISSAQFGTKLSVLFATESFTRAKAEEFYSKVELSEHLDELFKWQEKGVAIYLVSSGPNYYIDIFAQKHKVPPARTKSSTYHFRENGIIWKCDAVNAQDKHNFVQKEIADYDLTIGIGDSDQHDAFVSLCTIAMYTMPHKDYIHLTQFGSVSRIIEKLLEKDAGGDADHGILDIEALKKVTPTQAFHRLSVGLWIIFVGLLVASFSFGYSMHNYFPLATAPSVKSSP